MQVKKPPVTILLVDDDDALRSLVRQMLIREGFQVLEARDGSEALEVAAAHHALVDVLLTDVIMPKINGLVLAQRVLQQREGIRVLYMSGCAEASMLLAKDPEFRLVQKPFTQKMLIAALEQILASGKQPS